RYKEGDIDRGRRTNSFLPLAYNLVMLGAGNDEKRNTEAGATYPTDSSRTTNGALLFGVMYHPDFLRENSCGDESYLVAKNNAYSSGVMTYSGITKEDGTSIGGIDTCRTVKHNIQVSNTAEASSTLNITEPFAIGEDHVLAIQNNGIGFDVLPADEGLDVNGNISASGGLKGDFAVGGTVTINNSEGTSNECDDENEKTCIFKASIMDSDVVANTDYHVVAIGSARVDIAPFPSSYMIYLGIKDNQVGTQGNDGEANLLSNSFGKIKTTIPAPVVNNQLYDAGARTKLTEACDEDVTLGVYTAAMKSDDDDEDCNIDKDAYDPTPEDKKKWWTDVPVYRGGTWQSILGGNLSIYEGTHELAFETLEFESGEKKTTVKKNYYARFGYQSNNCAYRTGDELETEKSLLVPWGDRGSYTSRSKVEVNQILCGMTHSGFDNSFRQGGQGYLSAKLSDEDIMEELENKEYDEMTQNGRCGFTHDHYNPNTKDDIAVYALNHSFVGGITYITDEGRYASDPDGLWGYEYYKTEFECDGGYGCLNELTFNGYPWLSNYTDDNRKSDSYHPGVESNDFYGQSDDPYKGFATVSIALDIAGNKGPWSSRKMSYKVIDATHGTPTNNLTAMAAKYEKDEDEKDEDEKYDMYTFGVGTTASLTTFHSRQLSSNVEGHEVKLDCKVTGPPVQVPEYCKDLIKNKSGEDAGASINWFAFPLFNQ
ncbi:MAG: hypothetical protein CL521_04435, partial [Actinobacteria bacterium]|nr:hypothetical protein [Actinomycetota bacterium]